MCPAVETIRGAVDVSELGVTLMHEHVFVLDMEVEDNYPGRWNEEDERARAVATLQEAADRGARTFVDMTVVGLGRFIPRVADVTSKVGLNVVVATGLYTIDDLPNFFRYRGPGRLVDGPELLTDLFVSDITEGIADTGVKAGILKCATDEPGVTPGVERVLRCVARAHRLTGVPISTHTQAKTHRGTDQQRIFLDEGVDLQRVVIGHCGDTVDLDYLKSLIDRGSYIGMDRFGLDIVLPFGDRVDTVVALCEQGYADRMVLSHDASCFTHSLDRADKERLSPNAIGYTHLFDDVIPALKDRGVSEDDIDQMLVQNPRNIFSNAEAY